MKNKSPPPATQLGLAHAFVTWHTEKKNVSDSGLFFFYCFYFLSWKLEGEGTFGRRNSRTFVKAQKLPRLIMGPGRRICPSSDLD